MKATINTIITPGFSLQKMLTLANLAVTAYDVATTMRMVFCGEATVLDVALCIVKGLVVQSLISCVATAVFGEAAAFMLKLVGIGQDTYGLIEAIKSKDPKEIVIATVRLAVSVFTLKSQCFTGDTLVSTEEGNRRIDEIKPGDKVLSYNTETGENELQEVKNVSVSKTDILVHIITDDGRDIETTMFHPFYVKNEDGTGEWKAASNLKACDELLSEDGKKVKVSEVKVEKLAEEITVYNLELDEVHTYYVAGGVLVHNGCGTSDASDSEGGSTSVKTGEFFIDDWNGYPDAPKPDGPFRILEGTEYTDARNLANKTNANIHRNRLDLKGTQIHEMHPVKFGGSPTDIDNKIALSPKEHAKYTAFWNKVLREQKGK